ncbi:peptidylprolyl isomerase [bacterium]|nr:peptidylprolyl isomerase [bacterium]
MAKAKTGDTVKIHYTGTLDDGTEFDSSIEQEPLEFTIGLSQVITGFEDAVVGMNPGESKTFTVPMEDAYGPRREEMVAIVGMDQFPENIQPEIGQQFQLSQEDGTAIVVVVTDITDTDVTLDANHPLAGENLTFDIQLIEIA